MVEKKQAAKAKKEVELYEIPQDSSLRMTEMDQYLFGQGTHYDIFRKMGAHLAKKGETTGVHFAVWAPHAKGVPVVGEFNGWNPQANQMERLEPLGIYDTFVEGAQEGQLYKYCIITQDGTEVYKADPFASASELRPVMRQK